MPEPLKIFIGWDSREKIAYDVCVHSLEKHASVPLEIIPLKQAELKERGLCTRPHDPLSSTEFSFSRFLVPHLAGFEGWALFVDCEFLFTLDVAELFAQTDDSKAVMCVHHKYVPKETTKMDGAVQTAYPRKNWSSMMLLNCSHPENAALTKEAANEQTGAWLHCFMWLSDDLIGEIDYTWNFPEGGYDKLLEGVPAAIHYTRGGPWFPEWQDVDYGDLWIAARDEFLQLERNRAAS